MLVNRNRSFSKESFRNQAVCPTDSQAAWSAKGSLYQAAQLHIDNGIILSSYRKTFIALMKQYCSHLLTSRLVLFHPSDHI